MAEKKDERKDDDLWMGLKIVGKWIWRKIKFKERFMWGAVALFFAGFALFVFDKLLVSNADEFWKSALGLSSKSHLVFYGFGIWATLILAFALGVFRDLVNCLRRLAWRMTPKFVKECAKKSGLVRYAQDNSPKVAKIVWNFFFKDSKEEDPLAGLKRGQPALMRPYGPRSWLELGVIVGSSNIKLVSGELKKLWRGAIPSPPIAISGGKAGFLEEHHIVYLIEISWPEILAFCATFGWTCRKDFEELDKALRGMQKIDPEELPDKPRIRNEEELTKALTEDRERGGSLARLSDEERGKGSF